MEGIVSIKLHKFRFRKNIASFDFDYTLIKPKSKSLISKDIDDWMWLRPNIPELLQKLYDNKYCIMIFTNQSKEWRIEQVKSILEPLNIPMIINIAIKKDVYKPNPIMFNQIALKEWDKTKSFYCGDALGRTADWSDSDLKFAENIGINIKEPEEIFPFIKEEFEEKTKIEEKDYQELIILTGFPGSGKTTLANNTFISEKYIILHGDELTAIKLKKTAKNEIEKGKSVVIDATNPSIKKRAEYIDIAKEYKIPVRCIYIEISIDEAVYRNNKREKGVPKIVYNIFKKNLEIPTENEGCEVIIIKS